MRNKVYICGTGNVAEALLAEFKKHKIEVSGIFSRNSNGPNRLTYGVDYPDANSFVFLTVPDRYICETEQKLQKHDFFAIHTAGSVPVSILNSKRKGVFYPLQSFSKNFNTQWDWLPVLIESDDELLLETLFELAAAFGAEPIEANSQQREQVHLAAVFANNFGNAMLDIATGLAVRSGLNPSILNPLITQTVTKFKLLGAELAQTGPAKRGDEGVIQEHLDILSSNDYVVDIYRTVSAYLKNKYS